METLGTSQTKTNDPIKGIFTTTVDIKQETLEEVAELLKTDNKLFNEII